MGIITPLSGVIGMEVTIPNADSVVERKVSEDGRIYGLKKFAGRSVKVVVIEE